MRGVWKLTATELKLFLREPMAAFFTLVFPPMLLLLFGSIYGNKPTDFFAGIGFVDTAVPAFTALIIATTGLLSISIQIAAYRERKIFRRMRATPLRPEAILFALTMTFLLMTFVGVIILTVTARFVYGASLPVSPGSVLAAFMLSCLSFFVLGFVLSSLFPTIRTAQMGSLVIFYPMIFLSGATIPVEVLPDTLRVYNQVLPLTHVVTLLRGLWVGDELGAHYREVLFLFAMLVLGVGICAKTFRWE